MEIVDVRDGISIYCMTDNLGAAYTTRAAQLWPGGTSGLNLTGEGFNQLGEWDAGAVRATYQEFTDQGPSRVTNMDGNYATHYHSTHVAGTLIATGVVEDAKGMSYADLKAWQWSNDVGEMAAAAATNDSKNNVDNIEIVVINNPVPGNYTISIDHKETLSGGQQALSLIITGIDEYSVVPECSITLNTPGNEAIDVLLNAWISWEPVLYADAYDIYFGTDGGGTETPTNVYNGETINNNGFVYLMEPSTTYYLQVVPRNSQGTAADCNTIWSFTTMDTISDYPYFENFSDANIPLPPTGWQSDDMSEANGKITPDVDGIIFIGFHVTSTQGYGVFLDDVLMENWGLVGTGSEETAGDPKIYSYGGKVIISEGTEWSGSDVLITNLMGQVVYRGTFNGNFSVNLVCEVRQGMYIVKMEQVNSSIVRKVMIR